MEKWQGHTDIPLSTQGREQAIALSTLLSKKSFDACYSSDLSRALETAQLTLPDHQISIDPLLREINFGIYEGQTWGGLVDDTKAFLQKWWTDPYAHKLEGGESMECVNERILAFMETLPRQGRFAIFTHGGVIRNAIWQVVGKPQGKNWSLDIKNTSQTIIEYGPIRTTLRGVNLASHLD